MLPAYFIQDPSDVLDYPWDWSQWLQSGETISSSVFSVTPSGLSIASQSNTTTNATVWLSGGTSMTTYTVTNKITTTAGRTADRSATIRVQPR